MTRNATSDGIAAALAAYTLWGLVPVFFKQLASVPALEIIAHRVLWSLLLLGGLLAVRGRLGAAWAAAQNPRILARTALAAALLTVNWLVFVWAVNVNRVLETSLGYFITPLISVVLAVFVLHERLRPRQWAAVLLALIGVALEGWRIGGLPWVSLVLAGSFGLYGLLRKQLPLDAANGLLLETACAAPVAALYLVWLGSAGQFGGTMTIDALLIASGAVTAIPLLLFAVGARRLPLVTLGFLQYIAPSLTFLLAIFYYAEPMNLSRLLAFAAIWAGLALYSADLLLQRRQGSAVAEDLKT
ncbi:MAG: EamA family transporter RarD [Rhodocyclaceae bacterium]|nr:EamA family transporter RarD [Rhodocyclaceae bacterium]